MTSPSHRHTRHSDFPPTKSESGSWIALALAAIVLIAVGYFFLKPELPSPNMRAETPSVTKPPSK
jgi:hypothetical protein